jgi:uncharacterized caspase-like protein
MQMRAALIVGINHYQHLTPLYGCVNDARAVQAVLKQHGGDDGEVNFDCQLLTAEGPSDSVERATLRDAIEALFARKLDVALFYFAGHGHIETTGGYLLATDARRGDEGLSLFDVLTFANRSPAKNRIIVLDSCHSGIAGGTLNDGRMATLMEGVTVLTASTAEQYASEENALGIFTALFVDALNGGAANLAGDISPGSIYAYIDQSLGAFEQRPVFKTNVTEFVSLRETPRAISLANLRRLPKLFPTPDFQFPLDPSYEPESKGRDPGMPAPIKAHTETFAVLQSYNRLNLLVPVDAKHMWNAAMESKSCRLTALGQHYRRLVLKNRL